MVRTASIANKQHKLSPKTVLRAEVAGLNVEDIQLREDHWVIADLVGKGGHVRTVPVPTWVKVGVDRWLTAAGISTGPIFRAINKAERTGTSGFSPKVIWGVVEAGSAKCTLEINPRSRRAPRSPA